MDEARSLAAMLRQSIELGTDVGMLCAHRRLLRAEERANQLPVKMVGPLDLFIFPVILGIAMLPADVPCYNSTTATSRPIAEFCAGKAG